MGKIPHSGKTSHEKEGVEYNILSEKHHSRFLINLYMDTNEAKFMC